MFGRFLLLAAIAGVAIVAGTGYFSPSNPLREWENLEASAKKGHRATQHLKVRPADLTPEDALALSQKLEARNASRDLVQILKFAFFYKKSLREPARAALELVNEDLAKQLAHVMRQRLSMETAIESIDYEEGLELRSDFEQMTDCERAVATGQFVPLSGPQFCLVYDSGIFDLLPTPSSVPSRAVRLLARQTMAKLPRAAFKKVPRAAATMERYETKKQLLTQQLAQSSRQESVLAEQLLDLAWNVVVEFTDSR
jgi:hypothetical protein